MLNKTRVEQTPPAKGSATERTTFSKNNRLRSCQDIPDRPEVPALSRRCRSREASTRNDVRSSAGGTLNGKIPQRFARWRPDFEDCRDDISFRTHRSRVPGGMRVVPLQTFG